MKSKLFLLTALLCTSVLFLGTRHAGSMNAAQDQTQAAADDALIWTKWGAHHYALADDGASIWLGTASGLIRWNKAAATYSRYAASDGLPHRDVLATAVDGLGNRWFAGDGGLSRLDTAEKWTHYNTANSGIHTNYVDGIAAAADGTIWLSHVVDPNISQFNPDGTWVVYADRKSAVTSNYPTIKQTINNNSLWALSGNNVWVGYEMYDGSSWQTKAPPNVSGSPRVTAADSKGKVWFLSGYNVYAWDGVDWEEYPFWGYWDGFLNTLAVGENDEVWVGWQERDGIPYANHTAGISRVPDTPGYIDLEYFLGVPPPVTALLPAADGLWGTGTNWLLLPDGETVRFTDEPYFEDVDHVVVDKQGRTWLHSFYFWPYTAGVMQTIDDKGSTTLADDEGQLRGWASIVNVLEPAANGDLWIAGESDWRFRSPAGPRRFYDDSYIDYAPPTYNTFIEDIFVQDTRHAWFTYVDAEEKGVYSFDNGGTPLVTSDDSWHSYPIVTGGAYGLVAVQQDRIWYGDSSGLYLHNDSGWQQVSAVNVTDLVPAAGGALFVGVGGAVLTLEADGRQSLQSVVDLIANDLPRVRTATRRNHMWTIAPDGGVWFWNDLWLLERRDDAGAQVYQTPFKSRYIEVDQNNHIWLADGSLWRMSPRPDFRLELHPPLWLMTPDDTRSVTIKVVPAGGYDEMVTLAISGLPPAVSAAIDPNPLSPGEQATLKLTTAAAPLGDYELTVSGTSSSLSHERPFRLAIVEQVYDMIFPIVAR